MRWTWILPLAAAVWLEADELKPRVAARPVEEGGVTKVYLAPRFATAIRLPEAVSSVVLGDPAAFTAEHSEREPNLVFVKPLTAEASQTNLLISTVSGNQVSLLLESRGDGKGEPVESVDFVMRYKPAPSVIVPRTAALVPHGETAPKDSSLDELLGRQRKAPLPRLFGTMPVKAGVSEVIDQGRQVVVLFSAVNTERHAVELMPPQVQLGGKRRRGMLRRERWVSAEQLSVVDFRLSRRRIGPGERADGVMVFERPSYKQSAESVFLQVAESGAVDRPALAPIGFGIDAVRRGGAE